MPRGGKKEKDNNHPLLPLWGKEGREEREKGTSFWLGTEPGEPLLLLLPTDMCLCWDRPIKPCFLLRIACIQAGLPTKVLRYARYARYFVTTSQPASQPLWRIKEGERKGGKQINGRTSDIPAKSVEAITKCLFVCVCVYVRVCMCVGGWVY